MIEVKKNGIVFVFCVVVTRVFYYRNSSRHKFYFLKHNKCDNFFLKQNENYSVVPVIYKFILNKFWRSFGRPCSTNLYRH